MSCASARTRESTATRFSQKPGFHWSKIQCVHSPVEFCLSFGFCFSLGWFHCCCFCLVLFSHFFSFFLFCLFYEFILVEDSCVPFASFPFWKVSSTGFSPLFSSLHWVPVCQNVFLIPLDSLDIPCTIGKVWGFIQRDCSFHLPRIDLARARRCVTDTLSKKLKCVWMSTG